MSGKYFGDFGSIGDVIGGFGLNPSDAPPTDDEIVVAQYNTAPYSGNAFVLYQRDGKLYEVNDSHCSCRGLENWVPEETTKEALLMRNFDEGDYEGRAEYKHLIEALP